MEITLLIQNLGIRAPPRRVDRNSYLRCAVAFPEPLVGSRGREVVQAFGWTLLRAHVGGAVVTVVLVPKSLRGHGNWGDRGSAKTSSGWGL